MSKNRVVQLEVIQDWIDTYGDHNYVDYKRRAIAFVERYYKKDSSSAEERFAAYLLHGSIYCRIVNCRHNAGIYKYIECEWEHEDKAFLELVEHKKQFWLDWKEATVKYIENDYKHSFRPTIDRISEQLNYNFQNIQVLTNAENVSKATRKPHYVFKVLDSVNPDKSQSFCRYETKKEALKSIGLPQSYSDTGRFYQVEGSLYLIQSEDVTWGRRKLEDYETTEDLNYSGWLPVRKTPVANGKVETVYQQFTFEQMAIILKEAIEE